MFTALSAFYVACPKHLYLCPSKPAKSRSVWHLHIDLPIYLPALPPKTTVPYLYLATKGYPFLSSMPVKLFWLRNGKFSLIYCVIYFERTELGPVPTVSISRLKVFRTSLILTLLLCGSKSTWSLTIANISLNTIRIQLIFYL